jgi:hypothetical protein
VLLQDNFKITRIAVDLGDGGQGMEFDIAVPADLDQLGRDNSHGAVVGRKGLVKLGHGAADGRPFFHQVHKVARISQIKGSLHTANAAPHNYYGAQDFFSHSPLPLKNPI